MLKSVSGSRFSPQADSHLSAPVSWFSDIMEGCLISSSPCSLLTMVSYAWLPLTKWLLDRRTLDPPPVLSSPECDRSVLVRGCWL